MVSLNYRGLANSSGVYVIWNSHTCRTYVGSCKRFKTRWAEGHVRSLLNGKHKNRFLQADFNKCQDELGHTDFLEFDIVKHMPGSSRLERLEEEQIWITLIFDKGHRCYNLSVFAISREGCRSKNPEETSHRMSEARRGTKHWLYGKSVSDEIKAKISESKLGNKHSDETKEKMSVAKQGAKHPFFGKHHTVETKAKIAELRREYWRKRKDSLITEKVTS